MILSKQDLKYYLLRDKARNVGDCSFIKYYIKYDKKDFKFVLRF